MISRENLEIGQEVWFYEKWSGAYCRGKIVEFLYESNDGLSKEELKITGVRLNGIGNFNGSICRHFENIYHTREELAKSIEEKNKSIVDRYLSGINTVEDLVRFMYDSPLNAEEYTDYNAKKAVEIAAKELLDIEFER